MLLNIIPALFSQCHPDFINGNDAYKNGNFAEAADFYEKVIDENFEDAFVYYNLGNAYFKSNNIAHALLAYERAHFLNPRDKDIKNNLLYARLFSTDKIASIYSDNLLGEFWDIIRLITYKETIIATIALSLIAAVFLFIYIVTIRGKSRRIMLNLSISFWILTLFFLAIFVTKMNDTWFLKTAIVMSPSVDVSSSPTEGGEHLFTLHSGTRVAVLDNYGTSSRIILEDGRRDGWVPSNGIERVIANVKPE